MKYITFALFMAFPLVTWSQQPVIMDHTSLGLSLIPAEWIDSAKSRLHIGYGHTSHGSQLTTGMDALETYYPGGIYGWSHDGGPGELHIFEGSGYNAGYLELDCGYAGWDDETRAYLNDFPGCNVIIWSWCGQVDNVDLLSHYLDPMQQLEDEYPDVRFVYMTGHLEGLGPEGSLFLANQQIRDFCLENNKILFDFADIEKYDPDAEVNYQEYYADDACNYIPPGGGTANWANDWLAANPDDELSLISQMCGSCAHSVSLNCVKKGIACWYLWAMLAGWEGPATGTAENLPFRNPGVQMEVYPIPASDQLNIIFQASLHCRLVEILDLQGRPVYSLHLNKDCRNLTLWDLHLPGGVYFMKIVTNSCVITRKVSFL
jgi:hypothetical protein